MKTVVVSLACLAAGSLLQAQAQSISVVNPGFELPGTVKSEYWDASGAIVPGIIPGWEPSGPGVEGPGGPVAGPGDSGVEADTTYGAWRGYLSGLDPSIYQTTGYTIQGTEPGFRLTLAARDTFTGDSSFATIANSSVLNMSLYYMDGASRVSLGNQDFLLTDTFMDYTLDVTSVPGAAVGNPLGIELNNVSDVRDVAGDVVHAWQGLDNIRLSVVPEPGTVALFLLGALGLLAIRRRR